MDFSKIGARENAPSSKVTPPLPMLPPAGGQWLQKASGMQAERKNVARLATPLRLCNFKSLLRPLWAYPIDQNMKQKSYMIFPETYNI